MKNYFLGWYFKCQNEDESVAFIVARHQSKQQKNCSLQIITNEKSYNIDFPYESFQKQRNIFYIKIDQYIFSDQKIDIHFNDKDLTIIGHLTLSELSPLKYDIMGPFQYIPFMQCKHSVVSMKHYVNGTLKINNKNYIFKNALGYIEGDRGYSFPKQYAWTHCFFDNGSLMLSVADIPFGLFHFTGIIGVILFHNKEYRLATYLGAKVIIKNETHEIIVQQHDMIFKAKLIQKNDLELLAPTKGNMSRMIRESVSCVASYCFIKKNQILFSFENPHASFEYEY